MKKFLNYLNYFLITLFALGCVNVSLPKEPATDSRVSYNEPASPFVKLPSHSIDHVWRENKSGATISLYSECGNPTDPSLESISKGLIATLQNPKIISESQTKFSNLTALRSHAAGLFEGVNTQIEMISAKNKNCIYISALISPAQNYESLKKYFDDFLSGVRLP